MAEGTTASGGRTTEAASVSEILGSILDKLSLELVFAEVGKDQGLLPINSLLGELEEALRSMAPPAPMIDALAAGRQGVEAIFETGHFESSSLALLRRWIEWWQGALPAWLQEATVPAWPMEPLGGGKEEGLKGCGGKLGEGAEAGAGTGRTCDKPSLVDDEVICLDLAGDSDLLREFTLESQEHLQNIELGVLILEEHPTDLATLNSIFRAFHTFKGGSGFLNLRPINRLAHELESLLDLAREGRLVIDSDVINLILAGGDTLKRFVGEIEHRLQKGGEGVPIDIPTSDLLRQVRQLLKATELGPVAVAALPGEAQVEGKETATQVRPAAEAASGAGPVTEKHGVATSVKVDIQKLDGLVDLVGEMVIAQSQVFQDTQLMGDESQQLARNLAQLGRITKELQRVAMSLRMVPIRSSFQKMNRLVRDLARKAGKQVDLRLSGEETELDRTIVEEIGDPLIHMIRNSVDHGIEPAEVRLAQGKSPQGTVHLRAFHRGGNIVIEIEDDGAGLSRDRIRAKAIEKGVLRPGAEPPDSEIFQLIFAPGFSTAEKVTDISGRGVGMDVVRRNIEKLRGRVEIQSQPGRGSTFTLHLPLTLAIIDGMIVGVGGQRIIVPTLSVRESFRPTAEQISTLRGEAEMMLVRGHLLPVVRLGRLFGARRGGDRATEIAMVVESNRGVRCLMVDELLGKQEVVIKSLGETFKANPLLAGAAILGDGRVGLILDVDALVATGIEPLAEAA
jgi:two-component system chemotaxis sensor kinase CheA